MSRQNPSRRDSSPDRESDPRSFITPGHVRAYHMVRSNLYDNVTLWSCYVNGDPAVAIVLVDEAGENNVAVMPLFVSITEGMQLEFPGGRSMGGDSDGEGGPRRANPQTVREFALNKAALNPGGGQ
jgi:hypothetical protein